jgi:hypothetical protein
MGLSADDALMREDEILRCAQDDTPEQQARSFAALRMTRLSSWGLWGYNGFLQEEEEK